MTWDADEQAKLSALADVADVRQAKLESTQHLLGDTIALSEQAWQEPSRLAGWTRAHVASHLARNADALVRAVDAVLMGRRGLMYHSDEDRDLAIERGSERSGLDLQIDLDTSAGRLQRRLNVLESVPVDLTVELIPGALFRVQLLPLIRLNEVVQHHIDLDCGFEVDNLDPMIADWLLAWNALGINDSFPRPIQLVADSGQVLDIGPTSAQPEVISGSAALLLGWLTGRLRADQDGDLPASPAHH